jgi:hemerythrin-like domain-containing protein
MPSITSYLITEHAVFSTLFDEIERSLPGAQSAGEVNRLARLVEAVLNHHSSIETDLGFAALDHLLAERGEITQLNQEHEEIDAHLLRARTATDRAEAARCLVKALAISRRHFRHEERSVFPLFEKTFHADTLEALGNKAVEAYLTPVNRRTPGVDLASARHVA